MMVEATKKRDHKRRSRSQISADFGMGVGVDQHLPPEQKAAVFRAVAAVEEFQRYVERLEAVEGTSGIQRQIAGLRPPDKTADEIIEEVAKGDVRLWSRLQGEVTQEVVRRQRLRSSNKEDHREDYTAATCALGPTMRSQLGLAASPFRGAPFYRRTRA